VSTVSVLINPISGRQRRDDPPAARRALAERVLREAGFTPAVRVTEDSGHAGTLAREALAQQHELVIAWGGDGTVNEVAAVLAFTGTPLGIVPAGSGNGLADDLGVPRAAEAAMRMALGSPVRHIDAGEIDGARFFNLAGIGLDASIAARFAARPAGRRGLAAYAQITFLQLLTYRPETYVIDSGGEQLSRRALFIALANSRQYGNGALIAPRARVDDGRLEVVVVEPQPLARIAWRLPSLFRGTLVDSPGVIMRSANRLRISADHPIAFHVDGEPRSGGSTVEVCLHPAALGVRAPRVTPA
jgi:YegS/Rv2252/BmrU family lipid kinase